LVLTSLALCNTWSEPNILQPLLAQSRKYFNSSFGLGLSLALIGAAILGLGKIYKRPAILTPLPTDQRLHALDENPRTLKIAKMCTPSAYAAHAHTD
jgi:hypothetical protein